MYLIDVLSTTFKSPTLLNWVSKVSLPEQFAGHLSDTHVCATYSKTLSIRLYASFSKQLQVLNDMAEVFCNCTCQGVAKWA